MVLPVKGCDLVLGIQWLLSLGAITWNFQLLTMKFKHKGHDYLLQGIPPGGLHILTGHQKSKCLSMTPLTPCSMILAAEQHTKLKMTPASTPTDLQQLLREYDGVFRMPATLSPVKPQDHRIPLHDETKVVNMRPYRHHTVQKTKIEKLILEMLRAGTIRDSNNPFSSPVVLVKKKRRELALVCTLPPPEPTSH